MKCRHCGSQNRTSQCCELKISSKPWSGVAKKISVLDATLHLKGALQQNQTSVVRVIIKALEKTCSNNNYFLYYKGLVSWKSGQKSIGFELIRSAYQQGLRITELSINLAALAVQLHQYRCAQKVLKHLSAATSLPVPTLRHVFDLALQAKEHKLAAEFATQLIAQEPSIKQHYLQAITALSAAGQVHDAASLAQKASQQFSEDVELQLTCVSLLERDNQLTEAQDCFAKIKSPDFTDPNVAVIYSRLQRRNNRLDEARASLEVVLASHGSDDLSADFWAERLLVARATGRVQEALTSADRMHIKLTSEEVQLQSASVDAELNQIAAIRWPILHADEGPMISPVFIVGFPRCGSTLLEKLIFTEYQCSNADESVAMEKAEQLIYETCGVAWWQLEDNAQLPLSSIRQTLQEYYVINEQGGSPSSMAYVIDKNLTNLVRLPLLSQLFPRAPIIKVQRNPLDNVLSCYFSQFAHSHPWQKDLEQVTAHYLRLESHWQKVKESVENPIIDVRYEDIVNANGLTKELSTFLDVRWAAPKREDKIKPTLMYKSNTASYAQVANSVNSSSINFSEKYRSQLPKAILEKLASS